jgi:hypothetical protein
MDLLRDIRRYLTKPHVRPWALLSPILVLLICLPLLRPLRHPDPRDVSIDETARLATVQAIVENGTLAIDETMKMPIGQTIKGRDGRRYSDQPPVMAVLLSGSYWAMHRNGLTMDQNPILVPYLLTIIAVTLPVAGAAGLVYRMGRMFELKRPVRALMGAAVVLGSGLLSYGVVLNAHAPAAVLVMCAGRVLRAHRDREATGQLDLVDHRGHVCRARGDARTGGGGVRGAAVVRPAGDALAGDVTRRWRDALRARHDPAAGAAHRDDNAHHGRCAAGDVSSGTGRNANRVELVHDAVAALRVFRRNR